MPRAEAEDFGELYQLYYFLWQKVLYNNFSSSGQIAVFCNLWLEEAIEVQNVAKQAGSGCKKHSGREGCAGLDPDMFPNYKARRTVPDGNTVEQDATELDHFVPALPLSVIDLLSGWP